MLSSKVSPDPCYYFIYQALAPLHYDLLCVPLPGSNFLYFPLDYILVHNSNSVLPAHDSAGIAPSPFGLVFTDLRLIPNLAYA
jgi:hypothetical protein